MRDNWENLKVSDVVEVRVSGVDKKIYSNERPVLLCNYMDAYRNDYITGDISFSDGSVNISEFNRFSLKENDVIITKDSETPEDIAVSSVVSEDIESLVCGYHLAILRPFPDKIDGRFLMFKLKLPSIQRLFYRIASGSTRYGLTIGGIEAIKFSAPPLPQQGKIAQILSTCDAVIEKTEAAIAKYQAIKQGLMHDLFTRGIDVNTGKLRPKYEDAPELYNESELGWIPKEWEVKRLEELLKDGKSITYGIVQPGEYVSNGVYMIRSQDYTKGWNDIGTIMQVHPTIDKPYERSRVYEGDLLITVVGANVGRMAIVPSLLDGANISRSVARIAINSQKYSSDFCFYYLNSQIEDILYANQVGGAQPVINLKSLGLFDICLPSDKKEQNEISNRLVSLNNKLQSEQSTLSKYRQIKAGLMHDLLSGKVEVEVGDS